MVYDAEITEMGDGQSPDQYGVMHHICEMAQLGVNKSLTQQSNECASISLLRMISCWSFIIQKCIYSIYWKCYHFLRWCRFQCLKWEGGLRAHVTVVCEPCKHERQRVSKNLIIVLSKSRTIGNSLST